MQRLLLSATAAVAVLSGLVAPHSALAGPANGITIQSIIGAPYAGFMVQGNEASYDGAASADGRVVAFTSDSDNFTTPTLDENLSSDVFVRDNFTGTVTRITAADVTGAETWGYSSNPSISADGNEVAFVNDTDAFVTGDTNDGGDVYVYDRTAHTYTRASVTDAGGEPPQPDDGINYVTEAKLSANGNIVAFTTDNNMANGDTNGAADVYVRDLVNHHTYPVSGGANWTDRLEDADSPSITADGCEVAFESAASDIVTSPPDTNGVADIYLRDSTCLHTTTRPVHRLSVSATGGASNGPSTQPAVNTGIGFVPGASSVAFVSKATNLVSPVPAGVDGTHFEVYLRDVVHGTTQLISRVGGTGAAASADAVHPAVSPDGCAVAFSTTAALTGSDTNGFSDVYVVNVCQANALSRISRSTSNGDPNGGSDAASFNTNGQLLLFNSVADNLMVGDTNDVAPSPLGQDVFWSQWTLDTTPPDSLGITGLVSGAWSLSRSFAPYWSAWDVSGINNYTPETRTFVWNSPTGSGWAAPHGITNPTTATNTSFYGSTGRTYCWRLADATDAATLHNHAGAPGAQRCRAVPLVSTQLSFSSSWVKYNPAGAYGGVAYHSSAKGATMTRTGVVAKQLAILATTCSACGTAAVKWNGTTLKTFDFHSSTTQRSVLFGVAAFSAEQSGTLTLVITSSNKTVVVEGLGVYQDS